MLGNITVKQQRYKILMHLKIFIAPKYFGIGLISIYEINLYERKLFINRKLTWNACNYLVEEKFGLRQCSI